MKVLSIKTGILIFILALIFGMFYLQPSQSHPPEPPPRSDSATTTVANAEPDAAPPTKLLKPFTPAAQAKTGTQTVYRYTPPFRPKEKIPKALRGNLHAQQVLIVLEEAEVNRPSFSSSSKTSITVWEPSNIGTTNKPLKSPPIMRKSPRY